MTDIAPKPHAIAAGEELYDPDTEIEILQERRNVMHADLEVQPLMQFRRMDVDRMRKAKDFKPTWLVRGLLVERTFGSVAGPKKAGKSWFLTALGLAIATGTDFLGEFPVEQQGSVLYLTGESGFELAEIRAARYCEAMGLDAHVAAENFIISDDIAPATSPLFDESIRTAIHQFQPKLVIIDPWYTYSAGGDSANLTEVGQALAHVGDLVTKQGAALLIGHHFNASGSGVDLDRMTGAGFAEWVATWVLLDKRTSDSYDDQTGEMKLRFEIGSRSPGVTGKTRDWTFSEGVYNEQEERWTAPLTSRLTEVGATYMDRKREYNQSRSESTIIQTLQDKPWELTRSELAKELGGKRADVLDIIKGMSDRIGGTNGTGGEPGQVVEVKLRYTDKAGRTRTKSVLGLSVHHFEDYPTPPTALSEGTK